MSTSAVTTPPARRRLGVLSTLVLTALLTSVSWLLPVVPASADSLYVPVATTFPFPADGGGAGGWISCPGGTRAVSSGALSTGWLTAGLVTHDGRGAYHTAYGGSTSSLQVLARCVDPGRLAGSVLATKTVRDHRGYRARTTTVGCPIGTVAFGGGGFQATASGAPVASGPFTFGSSPMGNGWRYSAASDLGDGSLVASTHCLPRAKLGRFVSVTSTDTVTAGSGRVDLGSTARCPSGTFAFAGGAYFHRPGSSTPVNAGHLTVSTMAADDRGWTASGRRFESGELALTAKVLCTDRLG
jgi:hypothetical protein